MASGPSINLDYHAQGPRPRGTGPAYLVSRLISSYIGYLLVMGVLAGVVPRFEPAFSNLNLHLPLATRVLLTASRACLRYYLWAALLPIPAVWAVTNYNIDNKYRRRRLRLVAFIIVAAFLIFTLLALFLPMTSLYQGASAGATTTQK